VFMRIRKNSHYGQTRFIIRVKLKQMYYSSPSITSGPIIVLSKIRKRKGKRKQSSLEDLGNSTGGRDTVNGLTGGNVVGGGEVGIGDHSNDMGPAKRRKVNINGDSVQETGMYYSSPNGVSPGVGSVAVSYPAQGTNSSSYHKNGAET